MASSPQGQNGVPAMELVTEDDGGSGISSVATLNDNMAIDSEDSGRNEGLNGTSTLSPSSNGVIKRVPPPPVVNISSPSLTHHAPSIVKRSRVSIIREAAAPPPAPKICTKLVRWQPLRTEPDWNTIKELPIPRMGHRAVMFKSKMIIFGGGNQEIHHELFVFDTVTRTWSMPEEKGEDIPQGRASYGMEVLGNYIYIFGGMLEYGVYTDELYRLEVSSWTWEKLEPNGPTPCPRFGHSFTQLNDSFYVFGGLSNDTETPIKMPRYLGDLYKLQVSKDLNEHTWEIPPIFGSVPSPRESHSAVASTLRYNRLIIYGGMCGLRLNDLHFLDVDTLMWTKPTFRGIPPAPRSMHSANLVGRKMYIFGGWTPVSEHMEMAEKLPREVQKVWKVTNELHYLNLESLTWEPVAQREKIGEHSFWPKARAGHCSAAGKTSIFLWAGRDGFNVDENGRNACCPEMLELEVDPLGVEGKVQLVDDNDDPDSEGDGNRAGGVAQTAQYLGLEHNEGEQQEEEEGRLREEKAQRETEEYVKMKEMFTVEEEGGEVLEEEEEGSRIEKFIEHIKAEKEVHIDQLAMQFGLKLPDAIDRLKTLVKRGRLTGLILQDGDQLLFVEAE